MRRAIAQRGELIFLISGPPYYSNIKCDCGVVRKIWLPRDIGRSKPLPRAERVRRCPANFSFAPGLLCMLGASSLTCRIQSFFLWGCASVGRSCWAGTWESLTCIKLIQASMYKYTCSCGPVSSSRILHGGFCQRPAPVSPGGFN